MGGVQVAVPSEMPVAGFRFLPRQERPQSYGGPKAVAASLKRISSAET